MDKYNFDFIEYRIININFAVTGKNPKTIEINPRIEINHDKDEKSLKVLLSLALENSKAPFVFNVKLAGLFEFEKNIENEDLDCVANVNCAAILYPFIRETVADLTRRSGFPPLLLPPLNFCELYKRNKTPELPT